MATYSELYDLHADMTLLKKVCAAVAIACDTIRTETVGTTQEEIDLHTRRVVWARQAIRNVDGTARNIMWALLAQYENATTGQITGATDAQILTAVLNTVDLLA